MEQKITKKSERAMWSVYVFVEREVQLGRSIKRKKRLTAIQPDRYVLKPLETVLHKFLYLCVTKIYKKDDILHIQVETGKKKEIHRHEIKSVVNIQIRKHDRSGRIV